LEEIVAEKPLVFRFQLLVEHHLELFDSEGELHAVESEVGQSGYKIVILIFEKHRLGLAEISDFSISPVKREGSVSGDVKTP
jgi:hypothetical protein